MPRWELPHGIHNVATIFAVCGAIVCFLVMGVVSMSERKDRFGWRVFIIFWVAFALFVLFLLVIFGVEVKR